jgi:signal transduction histidine kinase
VIKNLLTNAIKFSFPNGQIIIHSSVRDGVWIFSMQDFGIGIAKEDIPLIFDRFVKLKASEMMNPNGIGIGLTICQNIINAYGGKIWAESEGLNTGATFTFQIKLAD